MLGKKLLRSRLTIRSRPFMELKICVHNHAEYELLRPRSTINPADVVSKRHPPQLAPVAETGFSHRLTAYKIVGHFFGLSYRKISGSNQVKNSFLESVTFQFHACMLSSESEVAQSLLIISYGHFSDLGDGIALSHRHGMLDFSGKANTSIHGIGEDDTATSTMCYT